MEIVIAVSIISSIISICLVIYFFSLLCDIRDTLHEIRDNALPKGTKKSSQTVSKEQTAETDSLPQKTCPKCGDRHDFDYPKCPKCKYVYED